MIMELKMILLAIGAVGLVISLIKKVIKFVIFSIFLLIGIGAYYYFFR